jgi:hypothetical protein
MYKVAPLSTWYYVCGAQTDSDGKGGGERTGKMPFEMLLAGGWGARWATGRYTSASGMRRSSTEWLGPTIVVGADK